MQKKIHQTLVLSYSNTQSDPRVQRQIDWLADAGSQITTVGIGPFFSPNCFRHLPIQIPPIWLRAFSYLCFRGRTRFFVLIKLFNRKIENLLKNSRDFDLIIFNDLELTPWAKLILKNENTHIHLDLHEYFLDQGIGIYWKLLFSRYSKWLLNCTKKTRWSTISTVAPTISKLYEDHFPDTKIFVILSAPEYSNLEVTSTDSAKIKLVHHGVADLDRGLEQLIESVRFFEERFDLYLLLVGSSKSINKIKTIVINNNLQNRVHLEPPVASKEIVLKINTYDLEIIFFPPRSLNLLHSLPNKYFEAVQARIGVVHGPSVNMSLLSKGHGFAVEVPSWDYQELAAILNGLSTAEIQKMKQNASESAKLFNAENEAKKFLLGINYANSRTMNIK